MERGKTGWIRLAVASGATAAGLAALLAGAAFGLQAVTLPRPSDNQLLAARTLHWLTAQNAIKSTAFVGGERVVIRKTSYPGKKQGSRHTPCAAGNGTRSVPTTFSPG